MYMQPNDLSKGTWKNLVWILSQQQSVARQKCTLPNSPPQPSQDPIFKNVLGTVPQTGFKCFELNAMQTCLEVGIL